MRRFSLLLLLLLLHGCPGFEKGAGRAADNAAGAFGTILEKPQSQQELVYSEHLLHTKPQFA